MKLDRLYGNRFEASSWEKRNRLWKVLCDEFFGKYLNASDDILDLAAGYCDFINNICVNGNMGRRIAVDLNPDVRAHAKDFVEVHNADARSLDFLEDDAIDAVFVSNFFEHIPDKNDIVRILNECLRVLRPGGKLMILQPNIKYLTGSYWDFFDHYTPLTEKSMCEAITLSTCRGGGYYILRKVLKKFLPYTTKSRLPQFDWLIRLYCHCPLAWSFMGKQMFIIAEKRR